MTLKNSITRNLSIAALALAVLVALRVGFIGPVFGQFQRVLITEAIDESKLVTLSGNTRPEARRGENDRGLVPDSTPVEHMFLQLRRPPVLEGEFVHLINEMHDKTSPNFRHWLTPQEIGDRFGPAQQDLDAIKSWLQSKGFTVHYVYPTRMLMDFSGTAGAIREAFHTEIHALEVDGQQHWANMRDPQIPEALAPAIVGVVSMHDFRPHSMVKKAIPGYTSGADYLLVPADFQTIYNVNPLLRRGITGAGQTVVVIEDSNVSSTADINKYRSTFLSKWATPALVQSNPTAAGNTCTNPGVNSDDVEVDLDAEIVSAMAPMATVNVASCTDGATVATFGGLIALENLVSAGSPPAIISMSYGQCEAANGSAGNAAFYNAFQSAAAAGVSVFASSGDESATSCSANKSSSTTGIGVSGWTSTPYNVSVGGTDFEDTYNASKGSPTIPVSTYWSSTNLPTDGSAKSYIPEIPWNDSCAGFLLYNYEGASVPYGSTGFCNSGGTGFRTTGSGSGGPSGCATGSPSTSNIVSGTCAGWPKPSWQQGIFGNPADGVRDIPDVSLFASNGIWNHYIIICDSDTGNGGASCSGAPSTWTGLGGTSASSPMMAGIQALINQKWGIRAGNPNPTYYAIANNEFGASGNSACYSINQPDRRGVGSACVFYDITQGDIVVNTSGTHVNSYKPSGTDGVLSTQTLTGVTVLTGGSGYTSAPTCTIAAPSNLYAYLNPSGGTLWGGGTQATCTAVLSGSTVGSITLNNGGQGYNDGGGCTLTGGGGSGATCVPTITATTLAPAYQPAYGTTPGWDFATGIGSVNAYNLVMNTAW
jgi:subtilase family serine protease